ncbi:unnamed protein product [Cyclocybe aegerita]|uniref:Uncharacterized protein n=1 Tax=Cyclocybe aegerita TaxID=1973307 RepID=A0A8S0WW48_CYCAE|nr:unnamed protein product [Cyclocybe aegerita]
MQRSTSPYRAPSPYRSSGDIPYPSYAGLPTGPATVGPGAITYTTSAGPDGRVIYHPFKAVSASYQTPSGVVSGIQWIPADASSVPPPGGQMMNPAVATDYTGWQGGYAHKEENKFTQEWQRQDEKRRKQEEKEAKRLREQGAPRNDSEYELRLARERDAHSAVGRDRRKSFNAGATEQRSGSVAFPPGAQSTGYPPHPSVGTGYPPSPYSGYEPPVVAPGYASSASSSHHRNANNGNYPDLTRQFNDLDMDHRGKTERERKASGGLARPRKYSTSDGPYERHRTISGNYAGHTTSFTPPSIPSTSSKYAPPAPSNAYFTAPSPNMRPSDVSYGTAGSSAYPSTSPGRYPTDVGRSTTPFGAPPGAYPPGHVLYEGKANSGTASRSRPPSRAGPSRAPSPNPVSFPYPATSSCIGKSPRIPVANIASEPQQLPAPEAFSRPINAANAFSPFDAVKIQDMDDVYDAKAPPNMPVVLATHDIHPADWTRCMQDLARSWIGQLPVPGALKDGIPPRRSQLTTDLIELWNDMFFLPRGVELILYKGRERRTGPQAGRVDSRLEFEDDSDTTSSDSSDLSDQERPLTDPYGRPITNSDVYEARRRRREQKIERKKQRKEKKARKKARARERNYSVFVGCTSRGPAPPPDATPQMMPTGYPSAPVPAGYGPPYPLVAGYRALAGYGPPGGFGTPAAYGAPVGIPVSRSQGYASGY